MSLEADKIIEDVEFDDQSFLWDFIDKFQNYGVNVVDDKMEQKYQYENFIQLHDEDPISLVNKLSADGIDSIMELTTAQASMLIPKIKLYKVKSHKEKDKKVEILFPFGGHSTLESITNSDLDRGTDAGIVSIDIRDTGFNPANVGIAFEGDIKLHFQSFQSIFMERYVGNEIISFAELLDQQGATGIIKTEAAAAAQSKDPGIDAPMIKMVVGWQTPSIPVKKDGIDSPISIIDSGTIEKIEKLTRSYIILPTRNNLKINDDASVTVTINFAARIEGRTLGADADLLNVGNYDPDAAEKIKNLKSQRDKLKKDYAKLKKTFRGKYKKIPPLSKTTAIFDPDQAGAAVTSGADTGEAVGEAAGAGMAVLGVAAVASGVGAVGVAAIAGAGALAPAAGEAIGGQFDPDAEQLQLTNLADSRFGGDEAKAKDYKTSKAQLEEMKRQYKQLAVQSRQIAYSSFLNRVRNSPRGTKRLFQVKIPREAYALYEELLTGAKEFFEKDKQQRKENKRQNVFDNSFQRLRKNSKIDIQDKISKSLNKPGVWSEMNPNAKLGLTKKDLGNRNQYQKQSKYVKRTEQWTGIYNDSDDIRLKDSYVLTYFYLGDLLESVMSMCWDKPINSNSDSSGKNTRDDKRYREQIRLLSGPFNYVDPDTGKTRNISIADIPVSLEFFNAWFVDRVVKRKIDKYPLRAFLRDLCSRLLNNVLSPKRFGPLNFNKQIKTRVMPVWRKKGDPISQKWKENINYQIGDITRFKASNLANTDSGITTDIEPYLFLYVVGSVTDFLNAEYEQDIENNIPHFAVGAENGIVKKIDFSRTKIKYKLESELSKQSGLARGNLLLADQYDSNLTLLGNPAFKPGSLLFIDTKALGLGVTRGKSTVGALSGKPIEVEPQWRADLGIGGYYRVVNVAHKINESVFETTLETISEFSYRSLQRKRNKSVTSQSKKNNSVQTRLLNANKQ